jgi:hypothetical protein
VTFLGGTHYQPFIGTGDDPGHTTIAEAAVGFLDAYLKRDASGLDRLRSAVSSNPTVASLQQQPAEG